MKILKKSFIFIILFSLNFISPSSFGKINLDGLNNQTPNYPTVEESFTVNAYVKDNDEIKLLMTAIPNTYVYQNSFAYTSSNNNIILRPAQYPSAKTIVDDHYGKTKVFSDNFEITLPYINNSTKAEKFILTVEYQGCLKDILCYPPKKVIFNLSAIAGTSVLPGEAALPAVEALPTTETTISPAPSNALQKPIEAMELLNSAKILSIIGGFILFGLLLSLTPCVLPMLPIISGIIAGHGHQITKWHAFTLSFIYVLSMAITYMLLGILVAMAGVNLISSMQHPVVIVTTCALFVFLAVASFGIIELSLPSMITQRLSNIQRKQKGGTYTGVAIMGILSALVISPCATAPLSGALLYISSTGNIFLGGIALFSMGFAMGMPILLFGTSAGHLLPKAGPWMKEINNFFGVTFLGLAIFLLSRIIPGPFILILSALLLIFYAVHLGLLEPAVHGWQRIQKGAALVMAIYGGFLLAGATQNNSDIFHPFGGTSFDQSFLATTTQNQNKLAFTKVNDIESFTNNLNEAKISKKITIVDFYADWCVSCRNIEKNVFTQPKISKILADFNKIKVDITSNTSEHQNLMSQLSVFNPPTIIFYNAEGKEIVNSRIIGEVDADSFYELIKTL